MTPAVVILCVLFFSSTILCITMTVAWQHFGRERHVLIWAMSFGLSVLQWVFNAGGVILGSQAIMTLASACIIGSSSLVAIGARQRAKQRIGWPQFLIGGGLAFVGSFIAFSPGETMAMRGTIATAYAGCMMIAAAAAVWPRGHAFTAPECAFFIVLILFALFQLCLTAAGASLGQALVGSKLDLYRMMLGIGLPSIYVAMGVSSVLVIAGDLATQLRTLVSHDQLTGLLNRRGMEEAAAKAIANARRHQRRMATVICDMDSFKAVNDGYGHIAGDAALRAFSQALRDAVRTGDLAGRLGGDEFCILLLDSTGQDAAEVMERVRGVIEGLAVDRLPAGGVSASFGITELDESDYGLDDMIVRADRALYEAKQNGRNQVNVWRKAA